MKNLINFFKLLLFPFINLIYIKKVLRDFTLALFFSFLFIPSSLNAAADTSCSNTATNTITVGETIVTDVPANNSDAYHQIIMPSTGNLTIVYQGTNDDVSFYIGTSCTDADTIYNNTGGNGVTHTVPSFPVSEDDMIYIKITNIGNNEDYSLTFTLTAVENVPPTAVAAATPTSVTVGDNVAFDGTGSNDTDGTISSYSWTEGTTVLNTTSSFTKSDFTVGTHTITLTVTDNDGATNINTDTNTVVITVDPVATNNTPTVSISPDTVTVPEGITTTDLQITLDEAPDTGDLNVTFSNSYDNSTGYLIIPQGVTNNTLTIDTASILQGTEFNITLTGATGLSGQNNGIVSSDNNFSTISIGAAAPDLSISKIDSADPVDAGTGFDYTITVYNKGTAAATGVSVVDTLPSGLTVDLTTSNNDSPDWNCTQSGVVLTCSLLTDDGNISVGQTKTILLHATAPSAAGHITNSASVSISNGDYDTSNNVATETTTIVAVGYQEIDEANQLCYRDTTDLNYLTNGTDCIKVGNFYYGAGCDATVFIKSDENLTTNLTDVNVTVMIAVSNNKDLDDGSCTSTQGNCTGPNPFAPAWSPSYLEAYMVPDAGTMVSDANFTIGHSDTHNKKPLYQIAVYATYNYNGVYHFGRVYNCDGISEGGIQAIASADTIDTLIDSGNAAAYNASSDTSSNGLKYLQTMVAADNTRTISGVHLNVNSKEAVPYIEPSGYDPGSLPFVIIPKLVKTGPNGECDAESYIEDLYTADGTSELLIPIATGTYSSSTTMTVPDTVQQDVRLQLIIVDPRLLSAEGQDCLATSSTSGNLGGIGQCANSEGQYIAGFSVDAWDRCGLNNGAPCLPQHGGYSGGSDPTYPGYNSIYDNEFGCYMCTFNVQPACSTDNFAIRPDRFNISMSATDAPNLLRAGNDYNVSLTAVDATNTVANSYTIIDHNFNNDLNTSTTRYFKDGTVHTGNLLQGTSSVNAAEASYMLSGLSSLSDTIQPLSAQEIIGVSYDDVGLVGLSVYDKNWAAVDNDDTPMDCNSSEHTYICGDLNVTFIPHHFNVENIHLRNHKDGNYTYLSNDLNMSAHIDANISARNAHDGITYNFKQGSLYYENPVSVDLNITEWLGAVSRHLKGNSTHKHDIPTETLLGFGGSDENGTHNIPWDESNATQQLMFNYTRQNDQTVNPFSVAGTDINVTVQSTYSDVSTPSSPAVISGDGIGDRNATFYFGRAKSSQFFYDDVLNSVQTPIAVVVYCDTYPTCSELNNEVKINEPYWWLSVEHDEATGDGNITLISPPTVITGAGNPTITPDTDVTVIPVQPGVDTDVYVNSGATTSLPMTVEIFLETTPSTDTNSWLIYNTASDIAPPDPFYKVRFIGAGGWAGHGDTGHVVDSNTSTKKNRRLGW